MAAEAVVPDLHFDLVVALVIGKSRSAPIGVDRAPDGAATASSLRTSSSGTCEKS